MYLFMNMLFLGSVFAEKKKHPNFIIEHKNTENILVFFCHVLFCMVLCSHLYVCWPLTHIHSKKKSTSEHLIWCFRLSQIEDSIQYLEGPNSTWKEHDRNFGVQMDDRDVHLDPKIPIMVLPGTIWSFQGTE